MKIIFSLSFIISLHLSGYAQAPSITSFSPASGPIGATVTITGTSFSTNPSNNIVFFGASRAVVTAAATTSLSVTVPVGATCEPITVTTGGLTGYSTQRFMVTHSGGSLSFNEKICFSVGSNPREMAMADLNNDGHLDLIVTLTDVSTAALFFGNGNGTFQSPVSITTGSGGALTVGDFSGDGVLDLAFANYSASANATASVLINNGTGNFPVTDTYFLSNPPVGIGSGAVYIADADFNLDGNVDLVSAIDNIPGSLSVLLNNGTLFNPKVEYPTNDNYPYSVTAADLNNDMYPDWVIANFFSQTAKVFINNGTGGILSEATYVTGSGSHEVELADLNKDGHLDLIVVNATGNSLSVLLNDGSGGFSPKTDYPAGTGYQPDVELADIDGDGNIDAVVGSSGTQIFIMKGDGVGGFDIPQLFEVGSSPFGIAVGDLDEDGEPDIATVNFGEGTICILLSKPPPSPEINIYNALSPNGDGKNESFFIQHIDLIPETQNNSVRIFNRWGDEVWSGKNYNNTTVKFEGLNNNGKELPGGIYFYKIELGNGEIKTGFISLKR
ncbi:MAG: VCBS repeat-containing protein [Cyclobacteriaceae bacterium]|nr:VCBS repeat-containing protein [Cyclobacteriaceae bacterium]